MAADTLSMFDIMVSENHGLKESILLILNYILSMIFLSFSILAMQFQGNMLNLIVGINRFNKIN